MISFHPGSIFTLPVPEAGMVKVWASGLAAVMALQTSAGTKTVLSARPYWACG